MKLVKLRMIDLPDMPKGKEEKTKYMATPSRPK